jgi:hypothetical protein
MISMLAWTRLQNANAVALYAAVLLTPELYDQYVVLNRDLAVLLDAVQDIARSAAHFRASVLKHPLYSQPKPYLYILQNEAREVLTAAEDPCVVAELIGKIRQRAFSLECLRERVHAAGSRHVEIFSDLLRKSDAYPFLLAQLAKEERYQAEKRALSMELEQREQDLTRRVHEVAMQVQAVHQLVHTLMHQGWLPPGAFDLVPSSAAVPMSYLSSAGAPMSYPSIAAVLKSDPSSSAAAMSRPSPAAAPMSHPSSAVAPLSYPSSAAAPMSRPSPAAAPMSYPSSAAAPMSNPSSAAAPMVDLSDDDSSMSSASHQQQHNRKRSVADAPLAPTCANALCPSEDNRAWGCIFRCEQCDTGLCYWCQEMWMVWAFQHGRQDSNHRMISCVETIKDPHSQHIRSEYFTRTAIRGV